MSSKDFPLEVKMHKILVDNRSCASCITCFHFQEETEICNLAHERPPAAIIVYGCEAWDGIPF